MEREKILIRIKKSLTLAGNNPSADEAQAAMMKAQELMARYKIEESELIGAQEVPKNIIEVQISDESRMWWKEELARTIAKNFRCKLFRIITDTSKGLHYFTLFGQEEDVEVAKEVYTYTENAINLLSKRYRTKVRKEGCDIEGVRDNYIKGFLAGLMDKFEDQADENPQWALVMVGVPQVVENEWNRRQEEKAEASRKWIEDYRKRNPDWDKPQENPEPVKLTAKERRAMERRINATFGIQQPKTEHTWNEDARKAGYEQGRNSGIGNKQLGD